MSIKTILVHLKDKDDQLDQRLSAARDLAIRFQAHVTAVFIATPHVRKGIGRGASNSYVNALKSAAMQQAESLKQRFDASMEEDQISHRFVVEEGNDYEILADHARAADLLIVSQGQVEALEDHFRDLLAEELVMISGVPVLMLPKAWSQQPLGTNVMIAWKSTREAVRAVRDSLDILQKAEHVTIVTVDTGDDQAHLGAAQLQAYLERHGVKADWKKDKASYGGLWRCLTQNAEQMGANCLIMGAYGRHGWFRRLTGDLTRDMARQANIPLILSH